MKKIFFLFGITFLMSYCSFFSKKEIENHQKFSGSYFGLPFPDTAAIKFADGFISNQFNVRDASFTPDGNMFFYSISRIPQGVIMMVQQSDNLWSEPQIAWFSGQYYDIEPFVTHDGSRIYFVSNRPLTKGGEVKDFDIWYVEKQNETWSEPINAGDSVNSSYNEFYPTEDIYGNLYFCVARPDNIGGEDILCATRTKNGYTKAKNVGTPINTQADEYNAFIAYNGAFLIYTTHGYDKGFGSSDLYISFNENGRWQTPKNMGAKINTEYTEFCPYVSPDGKFLFFTSTRTSLQNFSDTIISTDSLISILSSSNNGSSNLYWIDAGIIQKMK